MKWNTYICLDLETTGLEAKIDDIIEVAAIKVVEGEVVDTYEKLVYTPTELSEIVTFLTGIKNEDLKDAPEWKDISSDIEMFIGDAPIVGHNIQFDTTFLKEKGIPLINFEWDTYHMSTLLYPELPSHSLETNSLYFNLSHDDSHRAMSDVIASHELWQILINTFPQIDAHQQEQIQKLSQTSSWSMLPYFMQQQAAKRTKYQPVEDESNYPATVPPESVSYQESVIINCPLEDPISYVSKKEQQQLVVAAFPHTQEKIHQLFPQAELFVSPHKRYCLQKVEKLQKETSLTDAQTMLLLRIILNPAVTSSAHLALSHHEKWLWKDIQADQNCMLNHTNGPAYKDYHHALRSNMAITSQYFLLSHPEMTQHFERITLLDPQLMKENATRASSWMLTADEWIKEATNEQEVKQAKSIFADLNRVLKDIVPYSTYTEKVVFGNDILTSPVIKSLQKTIANMEENSENVRKLKTFFTQQETETVRWFAINPRFGTSLHMAPLDVKPIIRKALADKKLTIISNTVEKFSFAPDIPLVQIPPSKMPQIHLPELSEVKGTKKGGEHAVLKSYISNLLPNLKGKTAVVFGSKAKLKQYFFNVYSKELSSQMEMLGEDIGNGTGKLLDRWRSSKSQNKVIFLTFRNLRVYRPEYMDFDNIIFQSIPFDPPGDPITQARTAHLENTFMQFSIPIAKKNFLEVLVHFTKDPSRPTQLHLIDPRFQSNYGGDFADLVNLHT
jgi:DNA polymerase III epsilon subunit family exonuclease